jgi:hypothetical protein
MLSAVMGSTSERCLASSIRGAYSLSSALRLLGLLALLLTSACASDDSAMEPGVSAAGTASDAAGSGGSGGGGSGSGASAASAGSGAGSAGASSMPGQSASGAGGDGSLAAGGGGATVGGSGAEAGGGAGSGGGSGAGAPQVETIPTLYWLEISANRVMRSQDFAKGEPIVSPTGTAPDGVAVDVERGKLYWTNMGSPLGTGGGSLQRANLDGTEVETIVPAGIAQTPKQMQVDVVNEHVFFCDREGAKVWRAGLDGSDPQAVVSGHSFQELVGVALDVPNGKLYFGDRIGRKILRAGLELPAGESGADRTDIEELVVLPSGAMPIDLDVDRVSKRLYWTDRQLGTVKRAGLELPAGESADDRSDIETLVTDLVEPIGISLDVGEDRMYFTELGGGVSAAALDGSELERGLLSSGSATGVVIVHVPVQ